MTMPDVSADLEAAAQRVRDLSDKVAAQAKENGLAWLGSHFAVADNPGRGKDWLLYYLYGIERAGVLYGTEKIGDHDWYLEGAKHLLDTQGGDGSWKVSGGEHPTWDTCFAILFLKKATKPLVASTDGKR